MCRFNGEWRRAAELLSSEQLPDHVPGSAYPPAALAIDAEHLSLEFELGHVTDIQSRARSILDQALAAREWPLIIAMHRQLGMLAEERGDYRLARDHLDRACHYAEDLLETSFLTDRIPSRHGRVALRADCLRELAAAEWRAGESALAGRAPRPGQPGTGADQGQASRGVPAARYRVPAGSRRLLDGS